MTRMSAMPLCLPIMDAIAAEHPELTAADLDLISYKLQKKVVRTWLLEDGKAR